MMLWSAALLVMAGAAAAGQTSQPSLTIAGQVVLFADVLPRRDVTEFRPDILIDAAGRRGRLAFRAEATVEGLVARRGVTVTDAAVRPRDVWIEVAGARADLRAGYGRVIWGRLDEIQPSDVVNPTDAARFLLDGRTDARLPVTFVRGRVFVRETLVVEGVVVPRFRRGVFDRRDEATSPFNLVNGAVLPAGVEAAGAIRHVEPDGGWAGVSGGGRVSATVGRVDVAGAVFRGFDAFGPISFEVTTQIFPSVIGELVERHPRFTMISGDVETVTGKWALRGEAALFVERTLAGVSRPGLVDGRSFDIGAGVDRRAGDYRLFASVVAHREWSPEDPGVERADVSLVGSIERPLRRERWLVRVFGLVNPADRSSFLRGLVAWKPRDNVTIEASAAVFMGTSDDTIGRFHGRDFLFGRVRYHF